MCVRSCSKSLSRSVNYGDIDNYLYALEAARVITERERDESRGFGRRTQLVFMRRYIEKKSWGERESLTNYDLSHLARAKRRLFFARVYKREMLNEESRPPPLNKE